MSVHCSLLYSLLVSGLLICGLPAPLAALSLSSDRVGALLDSLESFFHYYSAHSELIDEDLVFGFLVIKGELGRLLKGNDAAMLAQVKTVISSCEDLISKRPFDWSVSKFADEFTSSLSKRPIVKGLPLQATQPDYTLEEGGLESGSPSRDDSDTCLLGLLIDGIVEKGCDELEKDEAAKGYTLIHQAIYFTIKTHLSIDEGASSEEVRRICAKVLGEHRQIRKLGFPLPLQDLFVEQVAVCGMNKFPEFHTDGALRMIQSLQTSRGCFTMREKQSHLQIDCYDHLSAVSAAAISTFL